MVFKLGDWNVICDFCGRKRKAGECRMTWDNFFVCADTCWQPRHPQDFVKGLPEDQTVPIARIDITQSVGTVTLASAASLHDMTITVSDATNIADGDPLNITLNNGTYHTTFSDGTPSGSTVTLGSPVPGPADSGNTVYLLKITDETYVTATTLTATGL